MGDSLLLGVKLLCGPEQHVASVFTYLKREGLFGSPSNPEKTQGIETTR